MSRPSRRLVVISLGALAVVVLAAAGIALALRPGTDHGAALGAPRFVDETATSGIDHTFDGGDYTFDVGGGVAVFDCDGDGRPDVYASGGAAPAALFRNQSQTGGSLRFTRTPSALTDLARVTGAYPIDIDADGVADLVVLEQGRATILRGLGGCRFEEAGAAMGVGPALPLATAFSATWEGANTLPTLAFGSYVDPASGDQTPFVCGDNQLVRPDGSGNRYAAPVPLTPSYCALSMLFSDWDGSGRRDLRVSNDRQYYDNAVGGEQLWRVEAGRAPRSYTAADGWALLRLWGMGIASYDVTGDGHPEVYLTTQGANTLQALVDGPATPAYHDVALKDGIDATRPAVGGDPLPSTAWHPEFQDVNNDGLMDLFVSKGNVEAIPDYAMRDPSNLFLGQPDGTYVERSEEAGVVMYDKGRGAALADFNNDGLLDLIQVNLDTPVRLFRSVGAGTAAAPAPMGGWLALQLSEPGGNRDAIGAVIETKVGDAVQRRELTVGGGHIGGQLGRTHVGLGDATAAEVRVTWPDGEVGPWMTVGANQFLDIARGATQATPWSPPGS